ncbi:MAG: shikimate kinase [Bilifractor porci]|jgi:shikimate kinase
MDNIILTGMPGVGKSTIGVILAKEIGYRFLDSDLLIQEREKRLLKEIIAEEGIDGFLEIENRVNASIQTENTVIATGGSAVYGAEAMRHFKETGRVVYLHLEYDQLKKRLGDLKDRGVVLREGQTLLDIYKERELLYRQYADLILDETGRDLENTLAELIRQLHITGHK